MERYIGVSGMTEGNDVLPDGQFLPPTGMSRMERRMKDFVKEKYGRTMTIGRTANLTKGLNGRPAYHYCGPCERGCVTHSSFNSSFTTVKDASKTGKCNIVTGASAYQALVDKGTNKATGISFIDRGTKQSARWDITISIV